MPALLARAIPIVLLLLGIFGILHVLNRYRGSPLKLTFVGFLTLLVVVLIVVIAIITL